MTRTFLLAAVFATILQSTPVTFTTIASGDSSQIDTERTATARTAAEAHVGDRRLDVVGGDPVDAGDDA